MTGFEIYCFCRSALQCRKAITYQQYIDGNEYGYFDGLSNYLIRQRKLDVHEIKDFIKCNYLEENGNLYSLLSSTCWDRYIEWKKTESSIKIYYDTVWKSFKFIENFCIGKHINLDKYKSRWAAKHIREKKIDWAVAVYLKLIDIKNVKITEKILLKNFLTQYNILMHRISDQKLHTYLNNLENEMRGILSYSETNNDKQDSTTNTASKEYNKQIKK